MKDMTFCSWDLVCSELVECDVYHCSLDQSSHCPLNVQSYFVAPIAWSMPRYTYVWKHSLLTFLENNNCFLWLRDSVCSAVLCCSVSVQHPSRHHMTDTCVLNKCVYVHTPGCTFMTCAMPISQKLLSVFQHMIVVHDDISHYIPHKTWTISIPHCYR